MIKLCQEISGCSCDVDGVPSSHFSAEGACLSGISLKPSHSLYGGEDIFAVPERYSEASEGIRGSN